PGALLAAVPGLFVSFSGSHLQRNLSHYYAAPVLPLLAWATLGALRRIERRTGYAVTCVLVAGLVVINAHYIRMLSVTGRDREGLALIANLPPTVSIAAPSHLVPPLSKRPDVYVIGSTWRQEPVELVLLDLRRRGWPIRRPEVAALATELEGN